MEASVACSGRAATASPSPWHLGRVLESWIWIGRLDRIWRAESMDDTEWVIIASYENARGRPVPLAAVRA